ncbi:MAG: hypothetical protein ACRDRK_01690 [Pseudonocardia sp.]
MDLGKRKGTAIGEWATAIELAWMPVVWANLLATHVDDGCGRCRACRSQVREAERWPCALHRLASAARQIARSR